jgi:exopolysaccharide biosynthesis predicted pyruvyltransferase EpsI
VTRVAVPPAAVDAVARRAMGPAGDGGFVGALSAEIDATLARLVPRGERVALVNFPNHCNAGDPALWLGELASLRRVGARVVHVASWASYRRDALARALAPGGTILLHGGGNFGDLYPHNQATTRERVLADFPHRRTIQLPQSLWFREAANRDRLRRLCEAHRDFTLLVREAQSLELARAHFAVPSLLCPDMAFALGTLPRAGTPATDVLWLARTDLEAAGWTPPAGDPRVAVVDWLGPLADEPPVAWRPPGLVVARRRAGRRRSRRWRGAGSCAGSACWRAGASS